MQNMKEVERIVIPVRQNVRSLCWHHGDLVDWVDGGTRYRLDGTVVPRTVFYAYRFDHALIAPNGRYVALIERLGTKGLILKNGEIVREINRSYYFANAYEYPIIFLTLPDG